MNKKILLIEDDKILQSALKEAIGEAGYDVALASDGEEGVLMAKKEKPDLILLDIILPKRNGYNVLMDLKNDNVLKTIPVIVLTVLGSEYSVETCKIAGAKDYLVKSDYSLEQIVEKIKKNL